MLPVRAAIWKKCTRKRNCIQLFFSFTLTVSRGANTGKNENRRNCNLLQLLYISCSFVRPFVSPLSLARRCNLFLFYFSFTLPCGFYFYPARHWCAHPLAFLLVRSNCSSHYFFQHNRVTAFALVNVKIYLTKFIRWKTFKTENNFDCFFLRKEHWNRNVNVSSKNSHLPANRSPYLRDVKA